MQLFTRVSLLEGHLLGTRCDVDCLYSETYVVLKLKRSATGHFVTLIEIGVHLMGHFRVAVCLGFEMSLGAQQQPYSRLVFLICITM